MRASRLVMGVDQGTTYTKVAILNEEGEVVSRSQTRIARHFPRRRWVEQDANEIWEATVSTMRDALAQGRLSLNQVGALGLCCQMGTVVTWNRHTLEPVGRAVSWQDTRTSDLCSAWNAEVGVLPYLASPFVTNATGPKLRWLLDNDVEVQDGVARGDVVAGPVSSWLLAKLTSGASFAMDYSSASTTQLVDLHTVSYRDELLSLAGVPRSALPEIRSTDDTYGVTSVAALGAEIPITAVLGDVPAAAIGAGSVTSGQATLSIGTGAFLMVNTEGPLGAGLLPLIVDADGYDIRYGGLASANVSGAAIEWLRDGLGLIQDLTDVDGIGSQVDDSGGVFFVPAFAGLSSPPDPRATGLLIGLGQDVTRANIIRAVLEGLAFQVEDLVQFAGRATGQEVTSVSVTGGASNSNVLMQTMADTLGRPLTRPRDSNVGALGAAARAGVGAGLWSDTSALLLPMQNGTQFDAHTTEAQREGKRSRWAEAVARASDWR